MVRDQLDVALTLLIAIAIANVIGAAICFPLAPTLAKLARVPGRILVPTVISLVMIGSYLNDGSIEDVLVTIIFGVVGVIMWRFGFNAPALLLGFILGSLLEGYVFLSVQIGGPLFFLRPICLFLILCLVAFFIYGPMKRLIKRRLRVGARSNETT
jgi:putative tricarboxylic transport membrane protein